MLTAWVLSASTGILLARYYRDAWADREIFKKPVWFQVRKLNKLEITEKTCL